MNAAATPSAMYVSITCALQRFYRGRGMWVDDSPCGALAGMLGPRTPWGGSTTGLHFFVSRDQLDALMRDLCENGRRGLSGICIAQTLRRMREAAVRAGERAPEPALPAAGGAMPPTSPRVAFDPLLRPPAGKAKQAFEHHAMQCLRDLVEFSQSSEYGEQK